MPQMSPMSWVFLMILSLSSLLVVTSSIYFCFSIKNSINKNLNSMNQKFFLMW
uniref:ATP synthase F0 subunit 8 n=1 Tax=Blastopsylla occidentalis TaxID=121832 RepID=A0A2U9QJJ0_BLAOC|nr:ATP synthase F0 subunit 8 [Blastopsylla occidentalis]AWU48860.1 ATP synthase F0 subunit 8 [Blastopsylla occidentalis]